MMSWKAISQASLLVLFVLVLHGGRSIAQNSTSEDSSFVSAVVQEALFRAELQHTEWSGNANEMQKTSQSNNESIHHDLLRLLDLTSSRRLLAAQINGTAALQQIKPSFKNSTVGLQPRADGLRVLIVGDSMTHCNQGDYTWRYRIWEWFRAQKVAVNIVGPYVGTAQPDLPGPPVPPPPYGQKVAPAPLKTSGGYAAACDPAFQSHHFAISGRSAAVDKALIHDVVANNPADLMLVMLGFNDLGWFYSDDRGLLVNMKQLIDNVRAVNPNMKFVIGTVPQRTYIGGRNDLIVNTDNYNDALKKATPGWSTPSSPVVWAPVREEYDCGPQYGSGSCPAAFDGLHPNELGEYQIARAFSRGLVSGLGIGSTPLTVPSNPPVRPLPVPNNFQLVSSPQGLTATWDAVYGAYSYDTEYAINGGGPFNFSPASVGTNRWDTRWSVDGWSYKLRVRARAGNRVGDWTGYLTATSHPQAADVPSNPSVTPTATGMDVTWGIPPGPYSGSVYTYQVYWYDWDGCAFLAGASFSGTSGHIDQLVPGHSHLVAVEAWNSAGPGLPVILRNVVPGRGTPARVQGLQIQAIDATSSHLTWTPVDGASDYIFWVRNINEAGSTLKRVSPELGVRSSCADFYFQFPGTWNYEWAVTAVNGMLEGKRSDPVTAPRPVSGQTVATCPGPPPICSGVPASGPLQPAPVSSANPDPPVGGSGSSPPGSTTTSSADAETSLPTRPIANCDDPRQYKTLDSVVSKDACANYDLLNVLTVNMTGSLSSYQDIMNHHYKDKYNAYARQVISQRYWTWEDHVNQSPDWFTCYETNNGRNTTVACKKTPQGSAFYYVQKDGFCDNLDAQYGLDCKYFTLTKYPYSPKPCPPRGFCETTSTLYDYDFKTDYEVFDPASMITNSFDSLNDFSGWLTETSIFSRLKLLDTPAQNVVDGASPLVFSVAAAALAMQSVADIGEKAEAEERKRTILAFIEAFLFLVPFVGEAAEGVAALSAVARLAKVVDFTGNTALNIYGAVNDPKSAPMAAFGILLGARGARDSLAWGKAADAFRRADQKTIDALGASFSANIGKIRSTRVSCGA